MNNWTRVKFYPGNNSKVICKCLTHGRALNELSCHYCSFFHLDNQCLPIHRKVSLLILRTASGILNKCFLGVYMEKAMALHSSTFAWKIPWMEEPGRLQSMGSLSWTRLSDFTSTFHFHALEKEMATHTSALAWRIPGTGEPDGLPCMGSHRVGYD